MGEDSCEKKRNFEDLMSCVLHYQGELLIPNKHAIRMYNFQVPSKMTARE